MKYEEKCNVSHLSLRKPYSSSVVKFRAI